MTSYKKLAQEAEDNLAAAMEQINDLTAQIESLQKQIIADAGDSISNEEAKQLLHTFSNRCKSRTELLMLIRTLTKL